MYYIIIALLFYFFRYDTSMSRNIGPHANGVFMFCVIRITLSAKIYIFTVIKSHTKFLFITRAFVQTNALHFVYIIKKKTKTYVDEHFCALHTPTDLPKFSDFQGFFIIIIIFLIKCFKHFSNFCVVGIAKDPFVEKFNNSSSNKIVKLRTACNNCWFI